MRKVWALTSNTLGVVLMAQQRRRPVRRPPVRRPYRPAPTSGNGSSLWLVIVVALGVIWFVNTRGDGGSSSTESAAPAGSPRELAAQVLKLGDDIVLTPTTRAELQNYANGDKPVNSCGDTLSEVDPVLLQVLLKLQQDGYRVLINNFGIGSDRERRLCFDKNGNRTHDQHMLLRAVDLNGIAKKGGPQTSWGGIAFRPGPEMEAIQGYADAWLAFLPRNRGGVGQEGCLDGAFPRPGGFHAHIPSGSTGNMDLATFTDACTHLHIDVRIR